MLYVVSTPIGNLSDITLRAVDTLKICDYILCEDTRHSLLLLNHLGISKPLKSFHKFNEISKENEILSDLQKGYAIALISDAGTPGISDPGSKLIQLCIAHNVSVTPIPGVCAAVAALSCSGLNTERFQFWGFLPRKTGELHRALHEILSYTGTTICYESPNRLVNVLEKLHEIAPQRQLAVARELTKKFEEYRRGTAQELLKHWEAATLRGEIVLMVSGEQEITNEDWISLTPQEHVALIQSTYGITQQEAIKAVSKLRGSSKREIYNTVHKKVSRS